MKPVIYVMIVTGIIAVIVPLFADLYLYSILTTVLIWIMLGQAWNLLGGFTGQISFGHAMFLAIGAYSSMIITNSLNLDMILTLLVGGLFAGLFSFPLGLLIFRLKGPYFALATLAFAEILHIVARNWKGLTNGGEGMMLSNNATFLGIEIFSNDEYFFVALLLAAIVSLSCYYLMKTKAGYSFIAIRENQDAAEAMGINSTRTKSTALFFSAFLAGVAGGFYGLYNKFIDPEMTLTVHMSAEMIFVTVLGGIGTILGPVIGSTILITLQEYLKEVPMFQSFSSLYLVIYGLFIMIIIVYLPGGIIDGIKKIRQYFSKGGDESDYSKSG
ncbi:branched-chain amino acid ABC transporter permease [Lentibacillus sp. CBA3610]|uniref:branched-chain amino acid ABC transporter permease n=1 Tax=Lentibacillus sp. CBA3610 TaxID=2518176 RepID=UPI00159503CD|nr:branched-chain amino acid ABC transporter permease [Lentibacillus sp. CBA3610]QKY68290.1 branched-chain amino acid ABC transporter permease [Lentibacillus sp. CBA3610]